MNQTEQICPICWSHPNSPTKTNCNHVYCEKCIYSWVQKKSQCPCCKQKIEELKTGQIIIKVSSQYQLPEIQGLQQLLQITSEAFSFLFRCDICLDIGGNLIKCSRCNFSAVHDICEGITTQEWICYNCCRQIYDETYSENIIGSPLQYSDDESIQ